MAGTKAGGRKTRETNLAKDPNYYSRLGRIGGSTLNVKKGFALLPQDKLKEYGKTYGAAALAKHWDKYPKGTIRRNTPTK